MPKKEGPKASKPTPVPSRKQPGAVGRNPSKPPARNATGRREQGVHQNNTGQWVNKDGLRVDGYGRLLPGQKQRPKKTPPPGQPTTPAPEKPFEEMRPAGQDAATRESSGAFTQQVLQGAMGYNPNDPTANYQAGFQSSMDRAYGNVMDRFNRSMQPEFDRQDAEFNQRMAEQGIDPNSGSYQAQYRALTNAQNEARQNAMSQATQEAYAVQQQGFQQQQGAYLTPFQAMQTGMIPWATQYGAEQEAAKQKAANEAALAQTRLSSGATVASARLGAEAQRYGYDINALNAGYPQDQDPSLGNTIIGAAVTGATQGIVR